MKIIKAFENISDLRAAEQHPQALLELLEKRLREVIAAFAEAGALWDPEEYGAFVIVEPGDSASDFEIVGLSAEDGGLTGACWESCAFHIDAQTHEVLVLYGGDAGWTFFVPASVSAGQPDLSAKLDAEVVSLPVHQGGSDALPLPS